MPAAKHTTSLLLLAGLSLFSLATVWVLFGKGSQDVERLDIDRAWDEQHRLLRDQFRANNGGTKGQQQYADDDDNVIVMRHLSVESDKEWIEAMRYDEIDKLEGFQEMHGLATKYTVYLRGGYKASLKLVEIPSVVAKEWKTVSWGIPEVDAPLASMSGPRRADRFIQGWAEIAAFHVDRALRLYRKPPAIGRTIPTALLRKHTPIGALSLHDRWVQAFQGDEVHVSMQAWLGGIRTQPPNIDIYTALIYPTTTSRRTLLPAIGDVSDVLVADYILDDHDRHKTHNWLVDRDNRMLLWDSGLSFNHGPFGRPSCMDLLCGPDHWKEHAKKELRVKRGCVRICRFRNSTISRLREIGPAAAPEHKLSKLVEASLAKDLLAPVFQFNLYYQQYSRFPKVRYYPKEFLLGLDHKVAQFLLHVDSCIKQHGEEYVIDPSLDL